MPALARKGKLYYATWYDPHTRKKRWESLSVFARQNGMISPVVRKSDARDVFEEWKKQGRDKSGPPTAINQLIERYKDHAKRYMTTESQRVVFNRLSIFLRWGLAHGVTHVSDLSQRSIVAFRDGLQCGPVTRHRYIESIRAMLNWAVTAKIVQDNPAKGIKREPNYQPRQRKALAPDTAGRLLAELTDPDRTFCALALLAGLRRSDIVYLEWADVDLKHMIITIRPKKDFDYSPKSTRYRDKPDEVPIPRELVPFLKALPRATRFVFDDGHGRPPYTPNGWTTRIKRKMLEIGVHSNIHELRHTFITHWARKGLNPLALRLIARHADLATTLKYTHLSTEDLRKEMESVDKR